MEVKASKNGYYEIETNDNEHERIRRLADIYFMSCEEVVKHMFAFADYMATTRILNKI